MATILNTAHVVSIDAHRLTAEASDLGWPAGYWPDKVAARDDAGKLHVFTAVHKATKDRQFMGVTYITDDGTVTLFVFND